MYLESVPQWNLGPTSLLLWLCKQCHLLLPNEWLVAQASPLFQGLCGTSQLPDE